VADGVCDDPSEAVADGVCDDPSEAVGVAVAVPGDGVSPGVGADAVAVTDSETPLGSELVGVADSVGGTELDGVPSGELDTEAPVESDAVDDSD
jgi:hypothetical protein